MSRLDAARALLERAVTERVTPGAQLSVRFGDGHSESFAVGALDYEPSSPAVTRETVFDLASITKVFTALSLVRLADREGVDLSRSLDTVLSWTRHTHAGGATLVELLSHRAGLVHWAPSTAAFRRETRALPTRVAACSTPW